MCEGVERKSTTSNELVTTNEPVEQSVFFVPATCSAFMVDRRDSDRDLRVLLVEDDPAQLGMVSKLIGNAEQAERMKIDLDFASSAKEGLSICELHAHAGRPHDLVLLDYLLPGGDADTVVAQMRSALGKRTVSSGGLQCKSPPRCRFSAERF